MRRGINTHTTPSDAPATTHTSAKIGAVRNPPGPGRPARRSSCCLRLGPIALIATLVSLGGVLRVSQSRAFSSDSTILGNAASSHSLQLSHASVPGALPPPSGRKNGRAPPRNRLLQRGLPHTDVTAAAAPAADRRPPTNHEALTGRPCVADEAKTLSPNRGSISCRWYPSPMRSRIQCCCHYTPPPNGTVLGPMGRPGASDPSPSVAPPFTCLPSLVIVGAQKSGSTALFSFFLRHPQVRPALRKELHFFDRTNGAIDTLLSRFPEWPDKREASIANSSSSSSDSSSRNDEPRGRSLRPLQKFQLQQQQQLQLGDESSSSRSGGDASSDSTWRALVTAGVPDTPLERLRMQYASSHVAIDATPSYMLGVGTAKRIKDMLPFALAIAILRDPVSRAYSEYQMKLRRVQAQIYPEQLGPGGFDAIRSRVLACFMGVVNGSIVVPTLAQLDAAERETNAAGAAPPPLLSQFQNTPAVVIGTAAATTATGGAVGARALELQQQQQLVFPADLSRCLDLNVLNARYGPNADRRIVLAVREKGPSAQLDRSSRVPGQPAPPSGVIRCIVRIVATRAAAVGALRADDAESLATLPALQSCISTGPGQVPNRRETIGSWEDIVQKEISQLEGCSADIDVIAGVPLPVPEDDAGGPSGVASAASRLLYEAWNSVRGLGGGGDGSSSPSPSASSDGAAGDVSQTGELAAAAAVVPVGVDVNASPSPRPSPLKGRIVLDGRKHMVKCWPTGATSNIINDFLYRGLYLRQLQRLAAAFGPVSCIWSSVSSSVPSVTGGGELWVLYNSSVRARVAFTPSPHLCMLFIRPRRTRS